MALSALRPTGNRILSSARSGTPPLSVARNYCTHWLSSGTAALALALVAAKSQTSSKLNYGEVILPAYGCPDLVAAAQYAGLKAILVDIQPDSPHYDYVQLRQAITANTIAIVAATLLGIRPEEQQLREIIGGRPIALIEDSAQWFPRDDSQTFFGDFVVVSFGRGKPVNLLGGGALLTRTELSNEVFAHIHALPETNLDRAKQHLRRMAYNALISPPVYGLVEKAPLLHLGATIFHELPAINAMHQSTHALLASNLRQFTQRDLRIQQNWRSALKTLPDNCVVDLCATHSIADDYFLLRYPLLIKDSAARDTVYQRLRAHGLGASIMYAHPPIQIDKVANYARRFADDKNATEFAAKLLTLPTHDAVTDTTISRTLDIIRETCLPLNRAKNS